MTSRHLSKEPEEEGSWSVIWEGAAKIVAHTKGLREIVMFKEWQRSQGAGSLESTVEWKSGASDSPG